MLLVIKALIHSECLSIVIVFITNYTLYFDYALPFCT